MTKLKKQHFVDQNRNQGLDVQKLSTDAEATAALSAAGVNAQLLKGADLDQDGRISKTDELRALFDAVDGFDTSGGGRGVILTTNSAGQQTREGRVMSALDALLENNAPSPSLATLSAAVGAGGTNKSADAELVQTRLAELGFDIAVDGQWGPGSQRALNAFDAMLHNRDHTRPARVDVGGALLRALRSDKAPGWVEMPLKGHGFINGDLDNHDYGSTLTRDVIVSAGSRYATYMAANPNAQPITTNDASVPRGGHTRDHSTHEGGLDLDVRLPRNDGSNGGARVTWGNYDRDATRAMIIAFAKDPNVGRILTGDTKLVAEFAAKTEGWASKIADGGSGHSDHLHIDIKAPTL